MTASTYTYATFLQRLGARLTDAVVLVAVWWPCTRVVLAAGKGWIAAYLTLLVLMVAYDIVMHGIYGQTLGKMLLRIRVVRVDGHPITWREAVARGAVDICIALMQAIIVVIAWMTTDIAISPRMSIIEFGEALKSVKGATALRAIGSVWSWSELATMLFNKRRRALHDLLGGTVVVRPVPK